MKFLKYLDVFGTEIKLRLEDKEKVSTTFGGFLSIITGILIIIAAYLLGSDVIYRQKPNSYIENLLFAHSPPILLNKETYPLAFVVSDGGGGVVRNDSIFKLSLFQNIYSFNENSTHYDTKELTLVQCRRDHFTNITDDIWLSVSASLCIDDQNITLQGNWGDPIVSYLAFSFYMCDYRDPANNCSSPEVISNFIDGSMINFNIYTIDSAVSVKNFSYPITKYANNRYKFAYSKMTKVVQYMVKDNTLRTDSGFFTESNSDTSYLSMDETQFDNYRIQNDNLLLYFGIYSSKQSTIQYRSYIKITEIFGSLGGILKLTIVVFELICLPFGKIEIIKNLLKELNSKNGYNFHKTIKNLNLEKNNNNSLLVIKNNKEEENSKNELVLNTNNKLNNNNNINNVINKKANLLSSNSPQVFKTPNTNKYNLKLKFNRQKTTQPIKMSKIVYYKLINFCCCKISKNSKNFEIYDNFKKSEDELLKMFNVSEIFKKFSLIDSLKTLLLNNSQLTIFELVYNKQNAEDLSLETQCHIDEFIKKQNKSELENKLLKMIEYKFKL